MKRDFLRKLEYISIFFFFFNFWLILDILTNMQQKSATNFNTIIFNSVFTNLPNTSMTLISIV